jgi:glycosyltransferase EpsH
MNNYKVSIIIPVYASEKFLSRALDSLRKQTLLPIETVVVNDGSPGNCDAIIAKYKNFLNIKYLKLPQNMGRMIARIEGMKAAAGEYIGFLDADDYVEPNMYESMYELALSKDADIVHCRTNYVTKNSITEWKEGAPRDNELKGKSIFNKFLNYELIWSVWDKIFKREIIEASLPEIPYDRVQLNEDTIICCVIFFHAKKYVSINKHLYNYSANESSAMSTRGYKQVGASLLMVSFILQYCRKNNIDFENKGLVKAICQWPFSLMHSIPEREIDNVAKEMEKYFPSIGYSYIANGLMMYLKYLDSQMVKASKLLPKTK